MVASAQVVMMPELNRADFFTTMGAFPTGVTIVTTRDRTGAPRGLTCNAFSSVSADPPMLLVCLDRRSTTLEALHESGQFVVNFLAAKRGSLSDRFAGKHPDKFWDIRWEAAGNDMPVLINDAIAYAACSVVQTVRAGDHEIVIGAVEEVQPPNGTNEPLVYFRRRYGTVRLPAAECGEQHPRLVSALPDERRR
jgi:flavin reductase (DIM6/NTAB) family NADH-FMN oxidoreductase RutF